MQTLSKRQLIFVFIGLMLAMFVSSLSETITATALPTIVGDLGGVEQMQWVTTAYILTSTVMMPIYGKLGDLYGRKYFLMLALVLYCAGSVVCGFAPNMGILITGRCIAGLGGGGLIILSQAAVADIVPARQRGKYLGILGSVFAVSTVIGPLLGGWFVQVTGWRWLFACCLPLAALAITACALFLRNQRAVTGHVPVDIGGMVSMTVAVVALVLATAWGGSVYAWASWQIIGLFVLCAISAVAFVLFERKAKEPIIPLELFKNRNFIVCTVTGLLLYIGVMGTVSYLPTYLQIVDELSPEVAGLMTVPMMAGLMITSIGTGFIASKTGRYKWMPIAMCVVASVGFFLMSTIKVNTPIPLALVYFFVLGFGIGLGTQILVLVVQNEFPHSMVGTATAANNFFRQIGSTLGSSLVGTLFTVRLAANLGSRLPASAHVDVNDITPTAVAQMPDSIRQIIETGYNDALVPIFLYFIPLLLVAFVLMCLLKENPLETSVNHGGHSSDQL